MILVWTIYQIICDLYRLCGVDWDCNLCGSLLPHHQEIHSILYILFYYGHCYILGKSKQFTPTHLTTIGATIENNARNIAFLSLFLCSLPFIRLNYSILNVVESFTQVGT